MRGLCGISKLLFFFFLLTFVEVDEQPGVPLPYYVARMLAAYPKVTYWAETHSTLEFKPRPHQPVKTRPPGDRLRPRVTGKGAFSLFTQTWGGETSSFYDRNFPNVLDVFNVRCV